MTPLPLNYLSAIVTGKIPELKIQIEEILRDAGSRR